VAGNASAAAVACDATLAALNAHSGAQLSVPSESGFQAQVHDATAEVVTRAVDDRLNSPSTNRPTSILTRASRCIQASS
jgi:hypothetical protein